MNAPRQVDEEARRRSEAATQQLMRRYEGGSSVGVKLMAKMGYGAAGRAIFVVSQSSCMSHASAYHRDCPMCVTDYRSMWSYLVMYNYVSPHASVICNTYQTVCVTSTGGKQQWAMHVSY